MTKGRTVLGFLVAAASSILSALVRVAQRWAAPGAGPKLVLG